MLHVDYASQELYSDDEVGHIDRKLAATIVILFFTNWLILHIFFMLHINKIDASVYHASVVSRYKFPVITLLPYMLPIFTPVITHDSIYTDASFSL
jgi:hypothetical protein